MGLCDKHGDTANESSSKLSWRLLDLGDVDGYVMTNLYEAVSRGESLNTLILNHPREPFVNTSTSNTPKPPRNGNLPPISAKYRKQHIMSKAPTEHLN